MASGAEESGDDLVVGRTNTSEDRTLLVAINGDNAPGGYSEDFVLNVSIQGDKVLVPGPIPHGVDAIHATGTVAFKTGGWMGTIPAGNGLVAQGINGAVGYVHAVPRDKPLENSVGAGLLGVGDTECAGVFGSGHNGVVGYEQSTARDLAFENTQRAGVLGRGEVGVSGDGANGAGVFGRGTPGVSGQSVGGVGVLAAGLTGLVATGSDGPGLLASSSREQGAVLESDRTAQLLLVPLRIDGPLKLKRSTAGELLATVSIVETPREDIEVVSLWFCKVGGDPTESNWVQLA